MSQDAIVMLKADHKEVRGLFREFQKASTSPVRRVSSTFVGSQRLTLTPTARTRPSLRNASTADCQAGSPAQASSQT